MNQKLKPAVDETILVGFPALETFAQVSKLVLELGNLGPAIFLLELEDFLELCCKPQFVRQRPIPGRVRDSRSASFLAART